MLFSTFHLACELTKEQPLHMELLYMAYPVVEGTSSLVFACGAVHMVRFRHNMRQAVQLSCCCCKQGLL